MSKYTIWQQDIISAVENYTNEELLEAILFSASGDDYDGCFTMRGEWEYDYLVKKLYERLGEWINEGRTTSINNG